jgi:hypothetical protein
MTRRRLILAIAAVLCGVAWWLSLDRLSAEERLLVGTWSFEGKSNTGRSEMRFWPDRRSAHGGWLSGVVNMAELSGPWFVRGGDLVLDTEPSAIRRAVRPLLHSVGFLTIDATRYHLESITADEMVLAMSDGVRETWTRAPAD